MFNQLVGILGSQTNTFYNPAKEILLDINIDAFREFSPTIFNQ
jgi:hypothetical protein